MWFCRRMPRLEVALRSRGRIAGDLAGSRRVADAALADTQTYGLTPLRWALACLLSDIGSDSHSLGDIAETRERSARFVTRHGGHWKMR